MTLNEAKQILNNSGYLVESDDYCTDLCDYLNGELESEKLGNATCSDDCIQIMAGGKQVCDIGFDEDDLCVNYDGKGRWFSCGQNRADIKKYIVSIIKKASKKAKG